MMTEDGYVRHTLTLLFDLPPEKLDKQRELTIDTLNIIASRITDLINADKDVQRRLRMLGADWGWKTPSWEAEEPR